MGKGRGKDGGFKAIAAASFLSTFSAPSQSLPETFCISVHSRASSTSSSTSPSTRSWATVLLLCPPLLLPHLPLSLPLLSQLLRFLPSRFLDPHLCYTSSRWMSSLRLYRSSRLFRPVAGPGRSLPLPQPLRLHPRPNAPSPQHAQELRPALGRHNALPRLRAL